MDHGAAADVGASSAADGGQGATKEGSQGTGTTAGGSEAEEARQGTAKAQAPWLEGVDPKSTYLLKVTLLGKPKKARKDIKGFVFEKIIDSDMTNYKDLIESIIVQYTPCYLEVAHVHYYDDVLKTFPEIKSDQELMSMFEKHAKTKFVEMFIAYWNPSEPYEPITEYFSDVHIQPSNNTELDEDGYLRNPIPENEHVGIDEEDMYLEKEPIPLDVVLYSDQEKDKDYDGHDESGDESEDGSEDESEVEEEELHEPNHAPNVEYYKEDPPMIEGSTYPNMDEFKLALSQYAIKHEFEYNTEKSTRRRFRGYCTRRVEDNCPWRIHASTTNDMCTVVVKKNPCAHDCSSARRKKKVKNATKHWICEKVKDWLIEGATLGAKELQKKLKEHHKVKIHYRRVYMALLKAIAGRPKTERYKGYGEKKRNNGKHLCPICKERGHHWHNCKKGNPDDIAAMMTLRGPPKKKTKTTKIDETSIVPCEDGAPIRMSFPPSQSLETTNKKKGKGSKSESIGSKRSRTGSNQSELLSIEFFVPGDETKAPVKVRGKRRKKVAEKVPVVPLDSPAMGTRSKKLSP